MTSWLIEAFGIAAVSLMVLSYALERRHSAFVFLFACGCTMAALYALLVQSYPFLVAEAIWAVIAFRRWSRLEKAL